MDFLSDQLVSSEYRDRLKLDLQQADLCRFLVSHVSEPGLEAIGRGQLARVLENDESFGISSLSCASGYEPLLKLQHRIGANRVRLKYFMDPMVKDANGIVLFHSKLVFLRLPDQQKSVVYVGSHNWFEGALGPEGPRTVEASLRFEEEYCPEQLTGNAASVVGQVNRHLLAAFRNPLCLPATPGNEKVFQQWIESAFRRATGKPLRKTTIILAAQKSPPPATHAQWLNLTKQGIYFQALEEGEGGMVLNSGKQLVVMVWGSRSDLQAGIPPVMLRCRHVAFNAGPNSKLKSPNQAREPMAGFGAALYDDAQLRITRGNWLGPRSSVQIWSGRDVQFFDFELRQQPSDSAQIDKNVRPNYQFYLAVDRIIFPVDRASPDDTEIWTPQSFAVSETKRPSPFRQVRGYPLPRELRSEILTYLKEELHVDTRKAKNLPIEEYDRGKSGRLISHHPLHETFIN